MKNLTKKEKILIMVLIVLIILIVSIITLKIIKTHDQKENTDFQIELDETIIKINEINKIYEKIDLDDPTKYQLMEGITCYKYNGNDMQNVVEKINDLYINTIETSGMFNVVISEINNTPNAVDAISNKYLENLSNLTGRNTIAYYSSFLSKPQGKYTSVSDLDIDGFMNAIKGMDCDKGLDLILHTPGLNHLANL